jgi:hypothetical protein
MIRSKKTHIASLLVFSLYALLHQPLLAAEPEQKAFVSSYEKLAQAYLPSLVKEAQAEKLSESERQQRNEKKVDSLITKAESSTVALKASDIELPAVGEVEKLELIYKFMHQQAQSQVCPTLSTDVLHDLEIFCGGQSELKNHIFGAVDHTVTAFGKIELQRMLLEPKTDITELQSRQEIIKTLIKNPGLVKRVDDYLKKIRASENELLWFWKNVDETTDQFFNQVYFGTNLSGLNTSSAANNASTLWTTVGSPLWWSIGLPLCIMAATTALCKVVVNKTHYDFANLPEAVQNYAQQAAQNPVQFNRNIMAIIDKLAPFLRGYMQIQDMQIQAFGLQPPPIEERVNSFIGLIKGIINFFPPSIIKQIAQSMQSPSFLNIYQVFLRGAYEGTVKGASNLFNFYHGDSSLDSKIVVTFWLAIFAAIFTFFYVMPTLNRINQARQFNSVSNIIQAKMIGVTSYVDAVGELIKIISADQTLNKIRLNHSAQIQTRSTEQQAQLKELLRLLDTNTMHGKPSFFSFKGNALAAFKLMQSTKDEFANVLQLAGKLDAYLAITKLVSCNPSGRYCFVNYQTNASTPYLKIDGFWHPMLNPAKVVVNNIELGAAHGARNAIITGPNAGGKSTALKSVVLAIIMAQTFGIAPAQAMTLTPFTQIGTYLNIADTIGKESLYQAEMNRAQALLNSINSLNKPGEFSFVIMDEIFTGTNQEEGSAGAFGIAKCLATFPQSMCLVATHYKQLTELEKATDGVFKNFKVSVVIHPDGKITPTYILDAGIADQKIALQLLQNAGFSNTILQAAQEALNNQTAHAAA